jgi:hypothetical protein
MKLNRSSLVAPGRAGWGGTLAVRLAVIGRGDDPSQPARAASAARPRQAAPSATRVGVGECDGLLNWHAVQKKQVD